MSQQESARLSEALCKAVGISQSQNKDAKSLGPAILAGLSVTVSRQAGARGTTVARELGRRLDYKVYDHELLTRIAEEMHVHVELLESVDERHVPWLVEQMEAFSSIPYVSENAFVRRLIETVLSLGAHGNCVIVGRGASFILPPQLTLRVRLVAEFEDRVQVIMRELGLPSTEASRRVKTIDSERRAFLKDHFHCDPDDPENYDLLINTTRLPIETCAEAIIAALRGREAVRAKTACEVLC